MARKCNLETEWGIREDAMGMGHVCGQTLKITVKILLASLEIHVKIGSPPLKCIQKNGSIPLKMHIKMVRPP